MPLEKRSALGPREPSFDEMVQALLDRVCKPRRWGDPELAAALAGIDPVMVPTPHGAVAAWRVGTGPATLLVHGWQDDSSLWSPLMAALLERSEPFVAFDLPAHGFSEGDRGLTFETADALHAVTDALGPIRALVAHSFTSGASALAVSEGLPATRVALIAPPLWPASASRFHRVADHLGFPVSVAERAQAIYRASTTPGRATYDARTQMADLDVELLLVSSLDDERMAVEDARTLAPKLPRGALFELHGPDHRETARHPDVIQRIVGFINEGLDDPGLAGAWWPNEDGGR
jgi:pimeloyl-ACP methyl ester carboxylesterase